FNEPNRSLLCIWGLSLSGRFVVDDDCCCFVFAFRTATALPEQSGDLVRRCDDRDGLPACFLANSGLLLPDIVCMARRKKSGEPVLDTVAHSRNRSSGGSATRRVDLRIVSSPFAADHRDRSRSSSRHRRLPLLGYRPSHFTLASYP